MEDGRWKLAMSPSTCPPFFVAEGGRRDGKGGKTKNKYEVQMGLYYLNLD